MLKRAGDGLVSDEDAARDERDRVLDAWTRHTDKYRQDDPPAALLQQRRAASLPDLRNLRTGSRARGLHGRAHRGDIGCAGRYGGGRSMIADLPRAGAANAGLQPDHSNGIILQRESVRIRHAIR